MHGAKRLSAYALRSPVSTTSWTSSIPQPTTVAHPRDRRLRQVAENARDPIRVVIKEYSPLESWVHDSARLVLIGQAAHAFPVSVRTLPSLS